MRDSKNNLNFVYTFRTYILIMFTTFSTRLAFVCPLTSELDKSFGRYSRPVGNVAFSCKVQPGRTPNNASLDAVNYYKL
jgi:hypothetical protein